jgi:hypothetical protein
VPDLLGLVLRQALALAVLAAWSWLVGAWLVRPLPLRRGPERYAFATAAGLAALGTALFGLGLLGWLTPLAIFLLAALIAVAASAPRLAARRRAPTSESPAADRERRDLVLLAALLAVLLAPTFVLGLYPPHGFDETVYHLPFAATFAESQRLVLVPDLIFPVLPQLLELLFTALVATAGDTSSHNVQFLCLVVSSAAVYAAAERFAGRAAALLAAAVWLSNPLVHYQASTSYVDLGFALFALLAVVAWEIGLGDDRRAWWLAAGAFAGCAAATKHFGLLWVALLAGAALCVAPRGRRWRSAILFAAAAAVTLAPWYLRLYIETGNPVFPLLPDVFAGGGSRLERAAGHTLDVGWRLSTDWLARRMSRSLADPWAIVGLPWHTVFDRARYNFQSPLSPYYLAIVPLVVWQARHDRRMRRWLALIAVYALLWTAIDPRFQLPSAALLAVGGGIALARVLERPLLRRWLERRRLVALALLLAAPGTGYAAWKVARQGAPPATPAARSRFLQQALTGYAAVELLNRECGAGYTLYGLNVENLAYYVQGRFLGHRGGPYRQGQVAPLLPDARALHGALARWRVDYLLARPFSGERRDPPPEEAVLAAPGAEAYFRRVPTPEGQLFEVLDGRGGHQASCRIAG